MPRIARNLIVNPGDVYHVYSRGNNGMPLFASHEWYAFYIDLIEEYSAQFKVVIYHFSLMPNHIHLLLSPQEMNLSSFMKILQNRFTKRYGMKTGFRGRVWQGRFKHRAITSDPGLYACGNYIEMNPVRAGLVAQPEEWRYSSYHHYAFGSKQYRFLETNPFYANLGRTETERQDVYRANIAKTRA